METYNSDLSQQSATGRIRIGIAEDHDIVRHGIVALLRNEDKVEVVLEACDGMDLVDKLHAVVPDLLLLDMRMPYMDGLAAIKHINLWYPKVNVLVITMDYDELNISELMELGVRGILSKNLDPQTLMEAIFTISDGLYFFDERIEHKVAETIRLKPSDPGPASEPVFSRREVEILQRLWLEEDIQVIADSLRLSARTVEWYKSHMLKKTGCKSLIGLFRLAIQNGMILESRNAGGRGVIS